MSNLELEKRTAEEISKQEAALAAKRQAIIKRMEERDAKRLAAARAAAISRAQQSLRDDEMRTKIEEFSKANGFHSVKEFNGALVRLFRVRALPAAHGTGASAGSTRGKLNPELLDKVKALAAAGKKAPTIAKELGISNPSAYAALDKLGIEHDRKPKARAEGSETPAHAEAPKPGQGEAKAPQAPEGHPIF